MISNNLFMICVRLFQFWTMGGAVYSNDPLPSLALGLCNLLPDGFEKDDGDRGREIKTAGAVHRDSQ